MSSDTSQKDAQQRQPQPESRSQRTLYRDLIVSIVLVVAGVFAVIVSLTYVYLSHKAEVQSADLTRLTDDHFAAIHQAFLDHQVLCFRDQPRLSAEQQIAFVDALSAVQTASVVYEEEIQQQGEDENLAR